MQIILNYLPIFIQNILISFYNLLQYRVRHGKKYNYYKEYFNKFSTASADEVKSEHKRRLKIFLDRSVSRSKFYSKYDNYTELSDFPILNKIDIINCFSKIATIKEKDAVISLTGGTTGNSMKVFYTKENTQERHAFIEHFREKYGYKLGKKCAWFSGKNIITEKDLRKGVCYRDDYINKIRYFSTFHITENNFDVYWAAFCEFAPEYMVGFPSSVYELCSMAKARGLKLENTVKVFFPTAETLLPIHREVISTILGCMILDQYASSEGAPYILECEYGGLHIHPLTGVFEVVDENMQPSEEGEILITSFTTEGTPLIRYRIGDSIKLAPEENKCACGSFFKLVDSIEGRLADYILSPSNGKINSVNLSNSTKGIKGIIQFQVIQNDIGFVKVLIVAKSEFTELEKVRFKKALEERLGTDMEIEIICVDEIPKERSGKFRVIKNLLK